MMMPAVLLIIAVMLIAPHLSEREAKVFAVCAIAAAMILWMLEVWA